MAKYQGDTVQAKLMLGWDDSEELNSIATDDDGNVKVVHQGVLVTSTPQSASGTYSTIAVGGLEVQALPANPNRVGAEIVNNGNSDMYLGFSSGVTVGSVPSPTGGALLVANGGAWTNPEGYNGPVHLISSGPGTVAAVQEW